MRTKTTLLAFLIIILGFTSLNAQIPNGGFETWEVDGNNDNNPQGWSTTNSDPDVSVSQYTPAYAGNYSMKVGTFNPGFMTIGGVAEIEFPYSQRPTSLRVCLKTNIMPGDKAYIIVALYQGDSIVAAPGNCSFVIDSTIANFTCLTFPITYQSALIPDLANIMITAGTTTAQAGTEIIVDELSFGFTSDINESEKTSTNLQSFPNPAISNTSVSFNLEAKSDIKVLISDAKGNIVQSYTIPNLNIGKNQITIDTQNFSNGAYSYQMNGIGFSQKGKFIVSK